MVINEVAWSGTATSSNDEWLELYNSGSGAQELAGWSVCAGDAKIVTFSSAHRIESGQFFLIERTDDTTISDIPGDYVGSFSKALVDTGLALALRSGSCAAGQVVDAVGSGAWFAGSASPQRASMERISATAAGDIPENWATWGTTPDAEGNVNSTGVDAAGDPIRGTPKFKNSVSA